MAGQHLFVLRGRAEQLYLEPATGPIPRREARPIGPQLGQFLLVNLAGYVINQAIFLSLDRYVFTDWGPGRYNLAKAIAIGVVLFWNFGINRVWTYRRGQVMRIGIDYTAAVRQQAGIGRYARSLIRALAELDHNNDYVLLSAGRDPSAEPWPANFRHARRCP